MGAFLVTTALVLACLEVALVGLLFVPADYTVSARTGSGIRFRLRWLFGIVRVEGGGARRPKPKPPHEARHRRRRPPRPGRRFREMRSIDGLVPRVWKLIRELIASLGLRRARIAVRAGTGDPAETGRLCGLVGPLLVWRPWHPALSVAFEPDFLDTVFDAEAEASGRVVPARLFGALGRFATSRPGRKAIMVLAWNVGR